METELLKIRFGTTVRTAIRFFGVVLVLAGAYHILVPLVDPTVPQFAPWRQFGFVSIEKFRGLFLGDALVMAAGAILAWFI